MFREILMSSVPVTPAQETAALSEPERIVDTFVAPGKTFTDIRRSAAWWGPFLIAAIISVMFVYSVDLKVGFRKATENQIDRSPKASARLEQMPPADRNNALNTQAKITRVISYGFPVVILIWNLLIAAVLFGTFKLGAGADLTFKATFAVVMYAGLVMGLRSILVIVSLFAGFNPDSFTLQNPAATNPGFFLDPTTSPFVYSLATSLDIFMIWTLILTAIGLSCVSRKLKRSTAMIGVFAWYAILSLASAALAAASS
jgi:hypothetical protein